MASATMAVAGSAGAVVAAPAMECRSASSAAFGSVRFAPVVRRASVKVNAAAVRASASEEPKAVRQAMVGLLAAGAILVSGVPAFALTGPGGDGAATTAKEADVLLNQADKLTKNDSPPTMKGGAQSAERLGSTAKQAGSAAASNVQNVADEAVTKAKENLAKAKQSFGNVMPKNKVSDASSVMPGNKAYTVSDASSAINDAKSSASSAASDAKSALSSLGDKLTGNTPSVSDVQGKASSAVADAKSKLPNAPSAGDVKSKASSAVADAKSKLPNAPTLPEKKAGQKF